MEFKPHGQPDIHVLAFSDSEALAVGIAAREAAAGMDFVGKGDQVGFTTRMLTLLGTAGKPNTASYYSSHEADVLQTVADVLQSFTTRQMIAQDGNVIVTLADEYKIIYEGRAAIARAESLEVAEQLGYELAYKVGKTVIANEVEAFLRQRP